MKKSAIQYYLIIFFTAAIFSMGLSLPSHAKLLVYDGFENQTSYNTDIWHPSGMNTTKIVQNVKRSGKNSLRILLNYTDKYNYRTELVSHAAGATHFDYGKDYWYGFSIYLPSDHKVDSDGEIVYQFHAVPDKHLNEPWRNPVLALKIYKDIWMVTVLGDSKDKTLFGQYEVFRNWKLNKWEKGKWTDWVFRVRWAYNSTGILQIWENGELKVNYKGINTFKDVKGPYLKFGLYKYFWKSNKTNVTQRIHYFDEIKIGDETSSFKEVSPGNGVPAETSSDPRNLIIQE